MNTEMLHNLLTGGPTRVVYVNRFGGCHVTHHENDAEHMWLVAFYAMVIGLHLNQHGTHLDVGRVVMRAVMHDVEESESGDFPRPFKHSSLELKDALDKAAVLALARTMEGAVPKIIQGALIRLWKHAKDETPEGRLLTFCDFLSVVSYVAREDSGGNNVVLQKHLGDLRGYGMTFSSQEYDFIRPWVLSAQEIVARLTGPHLRSAT